jgi:hypothetical protein
MRPRRLTGASGRPLNFTVSSHHHEPTPYNPSPWRHSHFPQIPFRAVSSHYGLYHRGDTAVPRRLVQPTNSRGRRASRTRRHRHRLDFFTHLLSGASRARVRCTSRKQCLAADPASRLDSLGSLRSIGSGDDGSSRFVAATCRASCGHRRRDIGWVPHWKCFSAGPVG